MGKKMVIVREVNRNEHDFYLKMGAFFGSRSIAKEVGINIYDDLDKRWFVAFDGEAIVGFASLRKSLVSDCYVLPDHRNNGIFKSILLFIDISTTGKLRANCTKESKKAFHNAGFITKRETKNFTYMEINCA